MEIKTTYEDVETLATEKYNEGFEDGKNEAVSQVMRYLESDMPLTEFLRHHGWIGDGADLQKNLWDWHWVRIARAVGREIN